MPSRATERRIRSLVVGVLRKIASRDQCESRKAILLRSHQSRHMSSEVSLGERELDRSEDTCGMNRRRWCCQYWSWRDNNRGELR